MKHAKTSAKKSNQIGPYLTSQIVPALEKGDANYAVEIVGVAPKRGDKKAYAISKAFADYAPIVGDLVASKEMSLSSGSTCLLRMAGQTGAKHLLLVSIGSDKEGIDRMGSAERMRRLGGTIIRKLQAERLIGADKPAKIFLDSVLDASKEAGVALRLASEEAAAAILEGAALASYSFDKYVSKPETKNLKGVGNEHHAVLNLTTRDRKRAPGFQKGLVAADALAQGIAICRDLGNEPSNELVPDTLCTRVKKIASEHGLKVKILDDKELAKEKMGLLLAVGQGSEHKSRMLVLEYAPKKAPKNMKTIAFVGKGMTFDSGGISIKPSMRMEDMKHDMCGAAAVIGAIVSASLLKLPIRIVTVVPSAENMPSGSAVCPGHIITSRSGKTVEITNTDAEGRLILADALDYIQDTNPDYIIDLATLTGAHLVALGKVAAGLMGNNEVFNSRVKAAAARAGERVWELPLYEEYFDDLKSEYADMRNSGDTPSHGTSKGAMFLLQFIRKGVKWVHLDIASVAYNVGGISYYPRKSSTGYGVRLLTELAKGLK